MYAHCYTCYTHLLTITWNNDGYALYSVELSQIYHPPGLVPVVRCLSTLHVSVVTITQDPVHSVGRITGAINVDKHR